MQSYYVFRKNVGRRILLSSLVVFESAALHGFVYLEYFNAVNVAIY